MYLLSSLPIAIIIIVVTHHTVIRRALTIVFDFELRHPSPLSSSS